MPRTRKGSAPLHVAMIGQKGLPATFGGIEHHVEQLGQRLVELGVRVTVYCRTNYGEDIPATYKGMHLVATPTIGTKHLDAIGHSITSTAHALRSGVDVIHYHAMGPGLVAPVPRYLSPAKVVLTVHGLDHERAKWNAAARAALGVSHWMSGHVPDEVVVVSRTLADHYLRAFGKSPRFITNGVAQPQPGPLSDRLREQFGITAGTYLLFVGRFVPEKRPDLLIGAAEALPEGMQIVMVGDSSFSDVYSQSLRELAAGDPRIVFTGYVYQPELGQLYTNASAFVQPSALEGLPLTLLESLSYDIPVIASDIAPHTEVLGGCTCGRHKMFRDGSSPDLNRTIRAHFAEVAGRAGALDSARLLEPYSWDRAAHEIRDLYHECVGRSLR